MSDDYRQKVFVTRFNDFVEQANTCIPLGGETLEPLDKFGCSYGLALCSLWYAHENDEDRFFLLHDFIESAFTSEYIAELLEHAKVSTETISAYQALNIELPLYTDFTIFTGKESIQFSSIIEFVVGVCHAQSIGQKKHGRS